MKVPIACSLTADAASTRIAEWQEFVTSSVAAAERDGLTLRLRLAPGDRALLEAVDLAAREKECCGFFSFAVEINATARTLAIGVPLEATAVLDDFEGLLRPMEGG